MEPAKITPPRAMVRARPQRSARAPAGTPASATISQNGASTTVMSVSESPRRMIRNATQVAYHNWKS